MNTPSAIANPLASPVASPLAQPLDSLRLAALARRPLEPLLASPIVRLAPITASLPNRNPKILLGGTHQPTLLRYLDGWPRRNGRASAFLIQFVEDGASLARFADNSFDLAVIQAPAAEQADEVIRQLCRVTRQGLITRR